MILLVFNGRGRQIDARIAQRKSVTGWPEVEAACAKIPLIRVYLSFLGSFHISLVTAVYAATVAPAGAVAAATGGAGTGAGAGAATGAGAGVGAGAGTGACCGTTEPKAGHVPWD